MTQIPKLISPLKYAGNKRFLAKRVERLILKEVDLKRDVVQEPFAGSLGFSLHFGFHNVICNDKSMPIANFWRNIKNGNIPPKFTNITKENYEINKQRFNELNNCSEQRFLTHDEQKELSDLLLYVNYAGYNGLMRVSKKSGFNIPFGKPNLTLPTAKLELCNAANQQMQSWLISNTCFTQLNYQNSNLLYIDPPYAGQFTAYAGQFNDQLQETIISKIEHSNSKIIISNSIEDPLLLKKYKEAGFVLYKTPIRRRISCKAHDRKVAFELVAFRGFTTRKIASLTDKLSRINQI